MLVYAQKVNKEELKACIEKAEALTADDVWQEGDRFNGKESEYLPKGSFWAVMTEKLSAAKAIYDSSESTQVAIDIAKDNLQSAIANLRNLMKHNPHLIAELKGAYYKTYNKTFTPRQIGFIVQYLGEP